MVVDLRSIPHSDELEWSADGGVRIGAAWLLRLGGAAGVEIWPLAEQGLYLTTFALATVVWSWEPRRAMLRSTTTQTLA